MNWLSNFLKKPNTNTGAPTSAPTVPAIQPVVDVNQLRHDLSLTQGPELRAQRCIQMGRAIAESGEAPQPDDASEIWVSAICYVADKTRALDWIDKIKNDAALSEIASRARSAEIRFAAAQRIESILHLEQLAQIARNKDKRVYHHCTDSLRQRRQAEIHTRRALEMTDQLHRLLAAPPLPHTPLLELKKELSGLVDAGEAGRICHELLEQALTQLRHESEALRDLQLHQKTATILTTQCQAAVWPWTHEMDGWQRRFNTLRQAQTSSPAWLANLPIARTLSAALDAIESRLTELSLDDERVAVCNTFLSALETAALSHTPADLDSTITWKSLTQPVHPDARQSLQIRWQALDINEPPPPTIIKPEPAPEPVVAPPPPVQRPQKVIDQDALRVLLETLEQNIAEGHLIAGDATTKQIKIVLGHGSLHGTLDARLHTLHIQLETLRSWARWGSQQAREKLIANAQQLINDEHSVEELATTIPSLREEWKQLNVHSAANKEQWALFDATLEQAYQPVAARRAEQAAHQSEICKAKEALCTAWETEWETHFASLSVEQADYKSIETQRAEWIKQWRAAPHAGFRDERLLRKRFDTLIHHIDQRLDAARSAEYNRRTQLIASAEALSEQTDVRLAIAEVKALQQKWVKEGIAVRLKRSDEQKQWTRYRAACNAVFERLDTQRAEHATHRQTQSQTRQNLIDAFVVALAILGRADSEDASQINNQAIKQALSQFKTDWEATRPTSRDTADKLEARAQELQQQAQQLLDTARHQKHRVRYQLLAQKAALAERVEHATLSEGALEVVLAETQEAWDALPPLLGKAENAIAERYAAASRVSREDLDAGRNSRAALLLDLEIALGLPSPKDFAEHRRLRQLDRLQNRFGTAQQTSFKPEDELVTWFATCALPDATLDLRITAVINQIAKQATST